MKRIVADTNVLVRLLIRDDVEQWEIANRLFQERGFLLLTTVVLETEWVLRSRYRLGPELVCELLEDMMKLGNVEFQERERVRRALTAHRRGMDFADALHVGAISSDQTLVTFDEAFVRRAKKQFSHLNIELAR